MTEDNNNMTERPDWNNSDMQGKAHVGESTNAIVPVEHTSSQSSNSDEYAPLTNAQIIEAQAKLRDTQLPVDVAAGAGMVEDVTDKEWSKHPDNPANNTEAPKPIALAAIEVPHAFTQIGPNHIQTNVTQLEDEYRAMETNKRPLRPGIEEPLITPVPKPTPKETPQVNPDVDNKAKKSKPVFAEENTHDIVPGLDAILEKMNFNQLENSLVQLSSGDPLPRIMSVPLEEQEGEQPVSQIFRKLRDNSSIRPNTVSEVIQRKIEHRIRAAERLGMLDDVYAKINQLYSRIEAAGQRPLIPTRKEELTRLKDEIVAQEFKLQAGKLGSLNPADKEEAKAIASYALTRGRAEVISRAEALYQEAINQTDENLMKNISDGELDKLLEDISKISPEAQLARIRTIVTILESRNRLVGQQGERLVNAIKKLKSLGAEGDVNPEVLQEMDIRIALHDSTLIKTSLPPKGEDIYKKATVFSGENAAYPMNPKFYDHLAYNTGLDMPPDKLGFKDIPVYDAYIMLQKAALFGWPSDGSNPNNRLYKRSTVRDSDTAITKKIADMLGKNGKLAVDLADKWATCNLEKFIWMTDANHPIAQLYHMDVARKTGTAGDIGPNVTVEELRLGTSMLRNAKYQDKKRVYRDDLFQEAIRLANNSDEVVRRKARQVIDIRNGANFSNPSLIFLDPRTIIMTGARDDIETQSIKSLGMLTSLKEVALRTPVNIKDLNSENLTNWHKWLIEADPRAIYNTRFILFTGIFESGEKEKKASGFDNTTAKLEMLKVLVTTKVDTVEGKPVYFMTVDELAELRKRYPLIRSAITDDIWKRFQGIVPFKSN